MTISSQTRKAGPFTGNGTTVNFPFSFKCFSSADLRVVLTDSAGNETDLTLTSQYTVALNADQNASAGGTVTTLTAYSSSYKITIVGDVDYTQETDITNGGGFYPEVIESAFDKITMQIQQVNEKADRAVKVDVSSGVSPTDYLTTVEGYKTAAAASAAAALVSENNADASEAAAAASAAAAALSYDNFDDRFLGPKSSAPTVDNDGNALQTGAMYFNTVSNDMYVRTAAGAWATVNNLTASTNAYNSEVAAAASAAAALTSENNADASEAAALSSKNAAATSETNAANSATASANSAAAALTSENNADASEAAALSSKNAAATSETNAANSANAAAGSASTANTKAGEASTSATNAANSATASANSAIAADASADAALISENNASASASAASGSASSASSSASAAAASYDAFDDRFLGAKSTPPALDNDGNAILTGALYWNTALNKLYIWAGSAWNQAAFDASGAVTSFNTRTGAITLSSTDVTDALTFTPATAAQGAKADSALQSANIGSSIQAYDADLDWVAANLTAAGKALLDDANAAGQRSTLGLGSMATQDASNVTITGGSVTLTADPSSDLQAATKQYVDNLVEGMTWKPAVNVLAVSNVPLTGSTPLTVDSHTLSNGYRLLLTGQSTTSENGIYDLTITGGAYTLTRAADADTYTELVGASVFVDEGTVYAKSGWVQTNHYLSSFSGQVWTQFSGAGSYTAGNGLSRSGTQFAIDTAVTVDLNTAQTMTNKTFVAPALGTPASGNASNMTNIPVNQAIGTLSYTHGGTGLTALGAANQVVKVNSAGTALEFGTVTVPTNVSSFTNDAGYVTSSGALASVTSATVATWANYGANGSVNVIGNRQLTFKFGNGSTQSVHDTVYYSNCNCNC